MSGTATKTPETGHFTDEIITKATATITEIESKQKDTVAGLLADRKLAERHIHGIDGLLSKLGHSVEPVAQPAKAPVKAKGAVKAKGGAKGKGNNVAVVTKIVAKYPKGVKSEVVTAEAKKLGLTTTQATGSLQALRRGDRLLFKLPKGEKRGGVYTPTPKLLAEVKAAA